jgi:hypothetical protein
MKILDIPQSGKRGLTVSQNGRYGQISRALVIPTNPRTAPQQSVRGIFTTQAARWRALTAAQRLAWNRMVKRYLSVRRGGTNGPLTGSQLFNKLNCTLAILGQAPIDAQPGRLPVQRRLPARQEGGNHQPRRRQLRRLEERPRAF